MGLDRVEVVLTQSVKVLIHLRPNFGKHIWVLEADIKGFFDNIAHESILKKLNRRMVKSWLHL